jgi:hypothetical protein
MLGQMIEDQNQVGYDGGPKVLGYAAGDRDGAHHSHKICSSPYILSLLTDDFVLQACFNLALLVMFQFVYYGHIWNRLKAMTNWKDALGCLLKGPGWRPGKPRLGDPNDLPDVRIALRLANNNRLSYKQICLTVFFFFFSFFVCVHNGR